VDWGQQGGAALLPIVTGSIASGGWSGVVAEGGVGEEYQSRMERIGVLRWGRRLWKLRPGEERGANDGCTSLFMECGKSGRRSMHLLSELAGASCS
jgi:hypothetical protein